jgi:hypothetical protein
MGEDDWASVIEHLNWIFNSYSSMYWPPEAKLADMDEEWKRVRAVSMPAFLNYFNSSMLASVEEIVSRIETYLSNFDDTFIQLVDITPSEVLAVTEYFYAESDRVWNELERLLREEYKARTAMLSRAEAKQWTLAKIRKEAIRAGHLKFYSEIQAKTDAFLKLEKSELTVRFGSRIAEAYWRLFVSRRGDVESFTYLTELNVAERKPVFLLQEGVAYCPSVNALYIANLLVLEDLISSSHSRDRFLKLRDEALEAEVSQAMRRLFGDSAKCFDNVYETEDLSNEHDLLILWNNNLFAVESKASPPTVPFRHPDKAYMRILRDFRSDTGIQKAYDQAHRVHLLARGSSPFHFYDSRRQKVTTIDPNDLDGVYSICVTRDNFGPLAVDLSLLLEKEDADPFPWAVNILDLNYMIATWEYFDLGPEAFFDFLGKRIALHGKVITFDELEIVGYHLRHGGLESLLEADADHVWLSIDYSDIFDEVYHAGIGGPPAELKLSEPVMANLTKRLRELMEEKH